MVKDARAWRTEAAEKRADGTTKSRTIDASAAFHNGPSFEDYFELRDIIASRDDAFARGFTEALIEYALGRPCGFTDEELVSTIVSRAREQDYALREFLHAIVASEAFRSN